MAARCRITDQCKASERGATLLKVCSHGLAYPAAWHGSFENHPDIIRQGKLTTPAAASRKVWQVLVRVVEHLMASKASSAFSAVLQQSNEAIAELEVSTRLWAHCPSPLPRPAYSPLGQPRLQSHSARPLTVHLTHHPQESNYIEAARSDHLGHRLGEANQRLVSLEQQVHGLQVKPATPRPQHAPPSC